MGSPERGDEQAEEVGAKVRGGTEHGGKVGQTAGGTGGEGGAEEFGACPWVHGDIISWDGEEQVIDLR